MKKLLASTAIIVALGGCASGGMDLPSIDGAPANPMPINAAPGGGGATLPLIDNLSALSSSSEQKSAPGVKRPKKSEMRGNTWTPTFDRDNEYVIPVQTTNGDGSRTVQQVMVTSNLPVGQGSCAHGGFEIKPFGSSVAIAPLPGAPVGAQVTCSVLFGGQLVKLVVEATDKRGISEMRLEGGRRKSQSFPKGVCSHGGYRVSNLVEGGPLGACVVVDANGPNTATYVKLPANAYEIPAVKTGDGQNARLARSTMERLPTGERIIRVQGPQKQVVLQYPNGAVVALTRGY